MLPTYIVRVFQKELIFPDFFEIVCNCSIRYSLQSFLQEFHDLCIDNLYQNGTTDEHLDSVQWLCQRH